MKKNLLTYFVILFVCQTAAAQINSGHLEIISPPEYKIYLNGAFVGETTPEDNGLIVKNLHSGRYRLKAHHPNFFSYVGYVNIDSQRIKTTEINLVKKTNRIIFQTLPTKCEISLSRKDDSPTEDIVLHKTNDLHSVSTLADGSYEIKLSRQGEEVIKQINISGKSDVYFFYDFDTGETIINDKSDARLPDGDWELLNAPLGQSGLPKKMLDHRTGITFVLIEGGSFKMGAPAAKSGDTAPVHKVSIDSFYLAETETTEEQWGKCIGNYGQGVSGGLVLRSTGGPNHPMQGISFDDTSIALLNLGPNYRLPTEAEWEYAARAGSEGERFYDYNKNSLMEFAWYQENSAFQTHAVKTKKPNPFGLYDMYGNVWEWCSDRYKKDYYAKSPKHNPQGPPEKDLRYKKRVLRGGGWFSEKQYVKSAYRQPESSARRGGSSGVADFINLGNYGFRLKYIFTP
jgi:formylglycine-generating enzyme required for sulfatase activity